MSIGDMIYIIHIAGMYWYEISRVVHLHISANQYFQIWSNMVFIFFKLYIFYEIFMNQNIILIATYVCGFIVNVFQMFWIQYCNTAFIKNSSSQFVTYSHGHNTIQNISIVGLKITSWSCGLFWKDCLKSKELRCTCLSELNGMKTFLMWQVFFTSELRPHAVSEV